MAKWSEETTYKFVEQYLKYECLYNPKSTQSKNKPLRDAAFREIAEAMDIPNFQSKDVYPKIRTLRSTYSQRLKRIKSSLRSGAGTGDEYIPVMKWFKFLNDKLKELNIDCRETESNLDTQSTVQGLESQITAEEAESNEAPLQEGAITETPCNNRKRTVPPAQQNAKTPYKGPKKRTLKDIDRLLSKVKNVSVTLNSSNVEQDNEYDIFGLSVAAQLKNLPPRVAIEGQSFIQKYLSDLRLQNMNETERSSSRFSAVSPATSSSRFTPQAVVISSDIFEYHFDSPDVGEQIEIESEDVIM